MKKLLIALGIPLGVGGLATLLAGGMARYKSYVQPPLSPPGWVFPVVWTLLYLAMGYASYRVVTRCQDSAKTRKALMVYGIQLGVNALWPIVFFRFEAFLPAFGVLAALWVLIVVTMFRFYQCEEKAGDLLVPYLLWVTFAGYLNLGVYLLNG